MTLKTLSNSAYVGESREEVDRWLGFMHILEDVIQYWTQLQSKILFAEAIFDSCLAKIQLPDAFTVFQAVLLRFKVPRFVTG